MDTNTSTTVIFCAGREGSLGPQVLRWALDGMPVQVEPVGGHEGVIGQLQAGDRRGRPSLGIVDRDAYPEAVLERQANHAIVLPWFEAESLLCHPELLQPLLTALGRAVPVELLLEELVRGARGSFVPAVNAHLTNAPRPSGRARLEQMAAQYAAQLARAEEILAARDVEALLAYFPGRRLAERMARQLDFLSPSALLEAARKELRPETVPPLARLRGAVLARLG